MLNQLYELSRQVVGRAPDLRTLRHYRPEPSDPAQATELAVEFSALVAQHIDAPEADGSTARQGAVDLFHFVARLPQWARAEIATMTRFPEGLDRAWQEAGAGAYVSLCGVVQDVWEHLFGPECRDDAQIEDAIAQEGCGRVVDFGCGAGHFAMALARRGIAVDAFEVDPLKVAFLRERAERRGLAGLVRTGPLAPPYDTVLAINVLDHLERADAVVPQFAELLREGGRLLYVAAFPDDGFHQSDPEVVERTFAELFRCFQPTGAVFPGETLLDVVRKGRSAREHVPREVAPEEAARLVPCPHPALEVRALPDEAGRCVVFARRFFVKPCYLGVEARRVLERFDGRTPLGRLCQELETEVEDVWPLVDFLWRHHALCLDSVHA